MARIIESLVICLSIISLSACQQIQQQNVEADQRMMAASAVCREGELTRKNALERRDCIDNAKRQWDSEVNYAYTWIVEQNIAADRESAVEYSEGEISKEKYNTAIQKHQADAMAAIAQANAQRRQAVHTDCNTIGDSVYCSSY